MNMYEIDLNLLSSLDILLDELNVTRAAARLNISQPALSAQLQRLRKMFGNPLLLPSETVRGMVATARALPLQAELRDLLTGVDPLVKIQPEFAPATGQPLLSATASDEAVIW